MKKLLLLLGVVTLLSGCLYSPYVIERGGYGGHGGDRGEHGGHHDD